MSKLKAWTNLFLRRYWVHLLFAAILLLVYRGWLNTGTITYGDWGWNSQSMLRHYLAVPFTWEPTFSLGQPYLSTMYWLIPQMFLYGLLSTLGVPFSVLERLVWIFPCLLLGVFGAYYLGKTLFHDRKAALVTTAAFILSTYFLRISTHGLFNLTASFAMTPLVCALFLKSNRERGLRYPILGGLALWLQWSFDMRFCYLTVLLILAGWVVLAVGDIRYGKQGFRDIARRSGHVALAFAIFAGANMFWLLANVKGPGFKAPLDYGQPWWISVLSFGQITHGFTMHEPVWPPLTWLRLTINKAQSVNPFFILVPIICFTAVLFAVRGMRRNPARARIALAGSSIALAGVFLQKGQNVPFGVVFVFLFNHLPGFNMFRDPNKLILYVILGFSILFGLATVMVTGWLRARLKDGPRSRAFEESAPPLVLLLTLCLLVTPALSGHLGGRYSGIRPVKVPEGYQQMEKVLEGDKQFYRTIWYPDIQRFATMDPDHPAIPAKELFQGPLEPLATSISERYEGAIESPLMPGLLDAMAVEKIVVPQDADMPEKRVFQGKFTWEPSYLKIVAESDAKSVAGNDGSEYFGRSLVITRNGRRGHVFVPNRSFSVLGGWDVALAANGAPGLDLNKSAYVLSEQGSQSDPAFKKGFPSDTVVAGEAGLYDTVFPFIDKASLYPAVGAELGTVKGSWMTFPPNTFSSSLRPYLEAEHIEYRQLDYKLGGVLSAGGYAEPPMNWQRNAKHLLTLDMSKKPLPISTTYPGLKIETDEEHTFRGAATARGSLKTVRVQRQERIAYSASMPVEPLHPYGIRFWLSGEKADDLQCKIGYYNSLGEWIGEQFLFIGGGTFKFISTSRQFITPANTAFCRFELLARENQTYRSSWNLSNIEIFNLKGISKHPEMSVPASLSKSGTYHLLARCVGIDKGASVGVSVDNGKAVSRETFIPERRLQWFDFGEFKLNEGEHTIELINLSCRNLINTFALITDADVQKAFSRLSGANQGKDLSCVFDLGRYPGEISYSRGRVTRIDSIISPATSTLVPAFTGKDASVGQGAMINVGGMDVDLTRATMSSENWWAVGKEVKITAGPCSLETSYPATSYVGIPSSDSSLFGSSAEWTSQKDGPSLSLRTAAPGGDAALVGMVAPGDPSPERTARSKWFSVDSATKYSALFTINGTETRGLHISLIVLDERGRVMDRVTLSDELSGTFLSRTILEEVKFHPGARRAAVEVVCHADEKVTQSWSLQGLLINKTEAVNPIDSVALVPRVQAFPSPGQALQAPADVELISSSYTRYKVKVKNAKRPCVLVFSEAYAPEWELQGPNGSENPVPAYTIINSYPLKRKGTYDVTIEYRPQRWVLPGLVVSLLTLLLSFAFLAITYIRRRKRRGQKQTYSEPETGQILLEERKSPEMYSLRRIVSGFREAVHRALVSKWYWFLALVVLSVLVYSLAGITLAVGIFILGAVALISFEPEAFIGVGLLFTIFLGIFLTARADRLALDTSIVAFALMCAGTLLGAWQLWRSDETGRRNTGDR
jgi:hypothetical protein